MYKAFLATDDRLCPINGRGYFANKNYRQILSLTGDRNKRAEMINECLALSLKFHYRKWNDTNEQALNDEMLRWYQFNKMRIYSSFLTISDFAAVTDYWWRRRLREAADNEKSMLAPGEISVFDNKGSDRGKLCQINWGRRNHQYAIEMKRAWVSSSIDKWKHEIEP